MAGADGRYRLTLPYANSGSRSSVKAGQSYRITRGEQRGRLAVSEAQVVEGAIVAGPDFTSELAPNP